MKERDGEQRYEERYRWRKRERPRKRQKMKERDGGIERRRNIYIIDGERERDEERDITLKREVEEQAYEES